MGRAIMLQGTGSHVGKSILTAALCRILKEEGYSVAPFKSQNMALNSYLTPAGLEIGRAQALQAEACGLEPEVEMNPILLKPSGEASAQVVVMGKPLGNMSARAYREQYLDKALDVVRDALNSLMSRYDVVVMEGAGSPVEMNLRHRDVVNMRAAKLVDAPVLLIGDIDRGGIFASLTGTINLLPPDERELVKGLIVNKFRGDMSLFSDGVTMLEGYTGKKVLGVVPYLLDLDLEEEDSVSLNDMSYPSVTKDINIAIVKLPRISNFTDFAPFKREPGVNAYYTDNPGDIRSADAVIIPGTKNTLMDLSFMRSKGLDKAVLDMARSGKTVVGICGGYQIMGEELEDSDGVEGTPQSAAGLSLLPICTTFAKEKTTRRVEATALLPFFAGKVAGYEIHMGQSRLSGDSSPAFMKEDNTVDGVQNADGRIWGTYLHGVFDNDLFRHAFINDLRKNKGLDSASGLFNYTAHRKGELDRLAQHVRQYLDIPFIIDILRQAPCR